MVKREDVIETTVAATSTSLEPAAEDSMHILKQEMMTDFTCLDVSMKNFSKSAEDFTSENLDKKVDFLLTVKSHSSI